MGTVAQRWGALSGGGGGVPQVPQLQVSPLWMRCAFLLSVFIAPSSVSEWSPWCQGIREEQRTPCSQQGRVSLPGSEPLYLAGYLRPQKTARRRPCASRKPVQHGVFLGSACGCQVTALPMRLFVCSLVVRAFLPSSTPGRKFRPTSLDEELPRLSGLRPPLQGFGGH